jgi:hypothetical protein
MKVFNYLHLFVLCEAASSMKIIFETLNMLCVERLLEADTTLPSPRSCRYENAAGRTLNRVSLSPL